MERDLNKEQAEGSRDTVDQALEHDKERRETPRARDERQGITNHPAGEERAEQANVPPRGTARKPPSADRG
jgi:hypothetical protein